MSKPTSEPMATNTAAVISGVNLSRSHPTVVSPTKPASPKYLKLWSLMWKTT